MTRPDSLPHSVIKAVLRATQSVATPFWLYETEPMRERVQQLEKFDVIRFAQKANSNIHVLSIFREMGVLVDAVSLGEIERALRAGYTPGTLDQEIVITADIIDESTLIRVIELGIPVNCGSLDMLMQLGQIANNHPVWLRLNPGFGHGHSHKTNTGSPFSKHGIWHENIADALRLVDKYGLNLIGLHMHIGSGADYTHLRQVCGSMLEAVKQLDRPISSISAGGGLPVPSRPGEPEIEIEEYYAAWNETRIEIERIIGDKICLEIEPGRFLTGNAGLLVAEIRAIKKIGDNYFVLLDTGFNELARPILYGSYHEIVFLKRSGVLVTGPLKSIAVAGPLCESGDVFTQNDGGIVRFRELPMPQVGDLAIIRDVGGYGATMSSNYNSRPLAPEILLDDGKLTIIRQRQSIEQLLDLEVRGKAF